MNRVIKEKAAEEKAGIISILIKRYGKKYLAATFLLMICSICMFINPIITVKIIDVAIAQKNIVLLIKLVVIAIITYLFQYILKYLSNIMYVNNGAELCRYLKEILINKISKHNGKFYSESNAGDLLTCVLDDTNAIKGLFSQSLFFAMSDLIIYVPVSILIFKIQPVLFLCIFFMQPFMGYISKRYNKKIYNSSRKVKSEAINQTSSMQEYLTNLLPIALIGGTDYYTDRIYKNIKNVEKSYKELETEMNKRNHIINFLAVLIITITLGIGGADVIYGGITVGELMVFVQYSGQLFKPIISISECFSQYKKAKISINRIENILKLQRNENDNDIVIEDMERLEFENVSFGYNDKKKCLDNVNMQFFPNQIVAIVGDSGTGKSTIINLLFRLWEVQSGSIKINNININKFNINHLEKMISIVSQNVILFNGSIMDNILLGSDKEDAVIKACKMAEIYEFICELPKKFDTNIGDKGMKLSGGQRQRIEIARALVKDAPIIVLDEATAAIDNVNEKKIFCNLQSKLKNKIIILITHRLTILNEVDNIYVFKEGRIVGEGKHRDLIADNLIYKDLYYAIETP